MSEDTNTGYRNNGIGNTGYRNTGYRNTGNWNTGNGNTGDWNTGYWNTGYRNTGNWNTGNGNTGDWNTGYWNTGDWNTGNNHAGCFNTVSAEKAYYFNTLTDIDDWNNAEKPEWLHMPRPTAWVVTNEMTDKEKEENPEYKTCDGYLRVNDMEEEWRKAFETATVDEIQMVRDLPNFNADVFKEITGLDLSNTDGCNGKRAEVDGVLYELKAVSK